MQMKQTAVEMIFESFFDMKWEDMQDWQKPVIFLQAKEMEKEQMIDFARNIIIDATCSVEGYVTTEKDIEEYYNEIYNKQ
jgi:hypothetical protein